MAERLTSYFVSDVHLGLRVGDPEERERRFLKFLREIPHRTTRSLFLLGDIWDFWYEYRDVIPKEGFRVVAELIGLMDAGVEVYFIEGNHDMWTYHFFEEIGIQKLSQPSVTVAGGLTVCMAHGDCLGKVKWNARLINTLFRSRVVRGLFSSLHPWIAYRFGTGWSKDNRKSHRRYRFRGEQEPLWQYACDYARDKDLDCFIFGHYHDSVDMTLPSGERFLILKDWLDGGMPHIRIEGGELTVLN